MIKSQILPFGISYTNESNKLIFNNFYKSEIWNLDFFNNLIQKTEIKSFQPNILIFDLDGEEWNLLISIPITDISLNCKIARKFEQILVRIK